MDTKSLCVSPLSSQSVSQYLSNNSKVIIFKRTGSGQEISDYTSLSAIQQWVIFPSSVTPYISDDWCTGYYIHWLSFVTDLWAFSCDLLFLLIEIRFLKISKHSHILGSLLKIWLTYFKVWNMVCLNDTIKVNTL